MLTKRGSDATSRNVFKITSCDLEQRRTNLRSHFATSSLMYGGQPDTLSGRMPDTLRWDYTMAAESQRTSRIEARISPEALKVVRRAAEIQGRSISDFVVAAAQEAAQRAISEVELLKLSSSAQEQFISLLLNPPRPTPGLARAFKRHRSLIATK